MPTLSDDALLDALLTDFYNKAGNDSLGSLYKTSVEHLTLRQDIDVTNKAIADEYNTKLAAAKTTEDFNAVTDYYIAHKKQLEPLIIDASLMNGLINTIVALKEFVLNGLLSYVNNLSVAYKGDWDKVTSYHINDYVMREDILWCAVKANSNQAPTINNDIWKVMFDFNKALKEAVNSLTSQITSGLLNKSDVNHTHTLAKLGAAASNHEHNETYAPKSHSDNVSLHLTEELKNIWNGKANGIHTHEKADLTGVASIEHTHNYAATGHNHNYSSLSGVASSGHEHTPGFNTSDSVSMTSTKGNIDISANYVNLASRVSAPHLTVGYDIETNKVRPAMPEKDSSLGEIAKPWTYIIGTNLVGKLQESSDRRLKKNIHNEDNTEAFNFINKLNIVNFQYIDDKKKEQTIGVIAQEVQDIRSQFADYCISENEESGYLSVSPTKLIYPLICSVQELTKQVKKLQDEVTQLKHK